MEYDKLTGQYRSVAGDTMYLSDDTGCWEGKTAAGYAVSVPKGDMLLRRDRIATQMYYKCSYYSLNDWERRGVNAIALNPTSWLGIY